MTSTREAMAEGHASPGPCVAAGLAGLAGLAACVLAPCLLGACYAVDIELSPQADPFAADAAASASAEPPATGGRDNTNNHDGDGDGDTDDANADAGQPNDGWPTDCPNSLLGPCLDPGLAFCSHHHGYDEVIRCNDAGCWETIACAPSNRCIENDTVGRAQCEI